MHALFAVHMVMIQTDHMNNAQQHHAHFIQGFRMMTFCNSLQGQESMHLSL